MVHHGSSWFIMVHHFPSMFFRSWMCEIITHVETNPNTSKCATLGNSKPGPPGAIVVFVSHTVTLPDLFIWGAWDEPIWWKPFFGGSRQWARGTSNLGLGTSASCPIMGWANLMSHLLVASCNILRTHILGKNMVKPYPLGAPNLCTNCAPMGPGYITSSGMTQNPDAHPSGWFDTFKNYPLVN
jgi:hypothetical protein